MYQLEEKGNIVSITIKAYNGDIVTHDVVKEKGSTLRIGGTASNTVVVKSAIALGVYTKESDRRTYCCVVTGIESKPYDFLVCGDIGNKHHQEVCIIETLDLNEKVRWLVMKELPEDVCCHFINFDIIDKTGKQVRRLRIDPFMGGGRII